MKQQILKFLLPLLFICACKTSKKTSTDNIANGAVINDESFRKPVKDKELYRETTEVVPIDTVYISKDTLNIVTKKLTGCQSDNFKLVWNGTFGKDTPIQTGCKLLEYLPGDCREHHKFHLTYNLTPLKIKNDTSAIKSTLIYIGGWHHFVHYVHDTPDSLLVKK
jgi:hypothetical protein